jgi:hypothetical protein
MHNLQVVDKKGDVTKLLSILVSLEKYNLNKKFCSNFANHVRFPCKIELRPTPNRVRKHSSLSGTKWVPIMWNFQF